MNEDKRITRILFIIALFAVTVLLHSIEFRAAVWNIDEWIFATGGQQILGGDILYRDYGDNKPPLIYYTYALLLWISGHDYLRLLAVSKIATILTVFLTGLGIYSIGRRLVDDRSGMIAGLFYVSYTICAQSSEILGGRTEVYANLMAVAGMYWFARKRFDFRYADMLACGLFLGLSALYNTRYGIMLAACSFFILFRNGLTKKTISLIACLALPCGMIILSAPLYYYQLGVFDSYLFWQSTVFKYYLNVFPLSLKLLSGFLVLFFLLGLVPLVAFAAYHVSISLGTGRAVAVPAADEASGLTARLSRFMERARGLRGGDAAVFLLVVLVLQYAAFFAGGIPGVRYFYMMYIPLSLLGAFGFNALYEKVKGPSYRGDASAALRAMLVLFVAVVPMYFYAIHWNSRRATIPESIIQYQDVAAFIRQNSQPRDRICVWYGDSPLYLFSQRLPATSMVNPGQFLLRYYYFVGDFQKETTAWDIFLGQLEKSRPYFIVDDSGGFTAQREKAVFFYRKNPYIEKKTGELRQYVDKHYEFATRISGYAIYRRTGIR